MDATFSMQTGAISYKIDLAVPAATGSWSVSLGYLDINPNVWNISGVSGKIYNNRGYVVGSYNPDTTTSLQGVIKGSGHTIYQDDVLLSNTETQDSSDYNQVSINGNYVGEYLPSVGIGGEAVVDEFYNLTVPFWNKEGDGRLLFVTENEQADLGFIRAVSGMGFIVDTGALTGAAGTQGVDVGRPYGLIVFGSATSSGLYHSGGWNALNVPMMSLNSHLVCPENLNWYSFLSSESLGNETGAVFPGRYFTEGGVNDLWAEFPTKGWERLVRDERLQPYPGRGDASYYVPYGNNPYVLSGVISFNPAPNEYAQWNYAGSPTNTEIHASAANGIQHSGLGSLAWVTYTDGGYQKIDGYVSGTAEEATTCWKTGDLVTITWPVECSCWPWVDGISAEIYEIYRGEVNDSFFYRFSTSHGVPPTSYDIIVEPSESCKCAIWATGDLMTVEFGDGSRIDGEVTYKDPFDGTGVGCSLNFSLNEAGVATEDTGILVYKRIPPKYASFEVSGSDTIVRLVDISMSGATITADGSGFLSLYSASGIFAGEVDPTGFSDGLQSDLEMEFSGIDGAPAIVTTVLSNTLGGTGASTATWSTAWGLDQIYNSGRVVPQTASYNVDNLYRRTTLTSGLYPSSTLDYKNTFYIFGVWSRWVSGSYIAINSVVTGEGMPTCWAVGDDINITWPAAAGLPWSDPVAAEILSIDDLGYGELFIEYKFPNDYGLPPEGGIPHYTLTVERDEPVPCGIEFNMYTGGVSTTDGFGGDIFVANTDSGKLITVWHKGFWTGGYSEAPNRGGFTQNELMSFSVTPTGNDWATGYNMWDTLTVSGKQLFVNAVAGFFID
jgi:hypothetical protein